MKIFFIVPYPLKESPSQRFRFEQYFSVLANQGYTYEVQSFLESHNWQLFFKPGKILAKSFAILNGFLKRTGALFQVSGYDFVFIHREAAPIGPPVFEWIIAKILRKRIIYDFDDAIWLTDKVSESPLEKALKWRRKVGAICKWSYKISCGNEYLRTYASAFNTNAVLNPTTIDTENLHNPTLYGDFPDNNFCVIGWTGSHSTLKYLTAIEPALVAILDKFPHVRLVVIADKPPQLKIKQLDFRKWSIETEITDLASFDIGIMPLPDDEWAKGKCGFKALQYMAMEVATIASPVGINTKIISAHETGLLASTNNDWVASLELLILDADIRKKLAVNGRSHVLHHYSVLSNTTNFLALFAS